MERSWLMERSWRNSVDSHERTGKYQNHRAIGVGDLYHDADAQRLRLLISFLEERPELIPPDPVIQLVYMVKVESCGSRARRS
jgi:hypothetical protein